MTDNPIFRVSVRDLAAAACPPRDLARGTGSRNRAMEGIREHTRLQDSHAPDWEREVPVSLTLRRQGFSLEIFGRMDGLLTSGPILIVEEIKTCRKSPEDLARHPAASHLAQLTCYGYMTARERNLAALKLRLTYACAPTRETAAWEVTRSSDELAADFDRLVSGYITLLENRSAWERVRNRSIPGLPFPYPRFRRGQRDLAEAVYKVVKHNRVLFVRAPTGTGKTMAVLFPVLKAMGLGQTDKIFYLTAKGPGRTVAQKAIKDLGHAGARIKSLVITAKQKICFTPNIPCDMDTCPYARAYYTKLNRAMTVLSKHDHFDRDLILETAKTYEICPFEFSLDLALACDLIICDLNYAFDPRVYLKRFFDRDSGRLTFLMDEAHNLPDRLRSMYSADINQDLVLESLRTLRDTAPDLCRALGKIHRQMLRLARSCPAQGSVQTLCDLPQGLMDSMDAFASRADAWLDNHDTAPVRDTVLEIFFTVSGFLNLTRYFGSHYRIFIRTCEDKGINVRLFCLDPAPIFSRLIRRCHGAVLFSATFFPFPYYEQVLFGAPDRPGIQKNGTAPPAGKKKKNRVIPHCIALDSPFPRENFQLLIHHRITTTYRGRSRFYHKVAEIITRTLILRPGNYLVFFSSYAYMDAVLAHMDRDTIPGILQVQSRGMDDPARKAFLDRFTPESRVAGFAVTGGIFGEGIDLQGKRLTGVMVVGVGLPKVTHELNEIRAYYDALETKKGNGPSPLGNGFFMAYQAPGFSRVLQAVGRLIRGSRDKGLALLMDERFVRPDYQGLFPLEWDGFEVISSIKDLDLKLKK